VFSSKPVGRTLPSNIHLTLSLYAFKAYFSESYIFGCIAL
jgi:hypothetical protein